MAQSELKRLALLTDGIYPFVTGGMQKHSYYLLKYLLKSGVKVLLFHCTLPENEGKILEHLEGVELSLLQEEIITFPNGAKGYDSYLKNSKNYAQSIADKLSNETDIDFIYAQGFTPWALLETERTGGPPIAVNFHGLEMYQYARGLKSKMIQLMFRKPVKFISQKADISYSLGGKLTDILNQITSSDKVRVLPIGIENTWLRPLDQIHASSKELQVAFIGRYERRKGIEELNQVMTQMANDPIQFQLIGPIPEDKQVQSESVTYHGLVKDEKEIMAILDACDVLAVPSMSEGMPTVILEAMARGLAIVASDVGAVSTEVGQENGWMIEPGNAGQLYSYLHAAMQMEANDLQQMKLNSRLKVEENFLWDRIIDLTLNQINTDLAK